MSKKRKGIRGGGRGKAGNRATGRSAAAQKQFKTSVKEARSKGIDTRGETKKENVNQTNEQEKQTGPKETFKSKFFYSGSEGVDPTVKKEDYKDPKKHKLRRQFDYLVDKYYGGTEQGAKEFAKTSQGQALLGYLAGVSADRGGGLGGDRKTLQAGAPDLFQRTQTGLPSITVDPSFRSITPLDIRNLSAQAVKDNLTKAGITDTNAFKRFNEALRIAAPNAFDEARPNFGQNLTKLAESLAPFPLKGLSYILPEKAIGGLSPDEYLDQSLFENLPTQTTDQGGMNDVAQFMIDNQAPIEEEEEETNIVQFDPNSFIPGFGFPFVDPSLFNLDGTGITGLQV